VLCRAGELLAQHPEVQDAQVPARVFEAIPESFRVIDEARAALLQGDVQASHPSSAFAWRMWYVSEVFIVLVRPTPGRHCRPGCRRRGLRQAFIFVGIRFIPVPPRSAPVFWRIDSICLLMRFFSWERRPRQPGSKVHRRTVRDPDEVGPVDLFRFSRSSRAGCGGRLRPVPQLLTKTRRLSRTEALARSRRPRRRQFLHSFFPSSAAVTTSSTSDSEDRRTAIFRGRSPRPLAGTSEGRSTRPRTGLGARGRGASRDAGEFVRARTRSPGGST